MRNGSIQIQECSLVGRINGFGSLKGCVKRSASLQGRIIIPTFVRNELYEGPYEVTPKTNNSQTLNTKNKSMTDDVKVLAIPYHEVSNEYGHTVIIGG